MSEATKPRSPYAFVIRSLNRFTAAAHAAGQNRIRNGGTRSADFASLRHKSDKYDPNDPPLTDAELNQILDLVYGCDSADIADTFLMRRVKEAFGGPALTKPLTKVPNKTADKTLTKPGGRPRSDKSRCACGAMTVARAKARGHRCQGR